MYKILKFLNILNCINVASVCIKNHSTKPLLVVLESESSAQELIRKSYSLRAGYDDEVKNIYINRDLTPAEALAAYEVRCKRRTDRSRSENTAVNTATNNIDATATTLTQGQLSASAAEFNPTILLATPGGNTDCS